MLYTKKNAFKKTKKPLSTARRFLIRSCNRLLEGEFSFRDVAEKLSRNVSTVDDCWELWSRDGTVSRRPGSGRTRCTTEREDRRIRRAECVYSIDSKPLCLRRQRCQARAHWRTVWRSVAFSEESRFCFDASEDHVLVRRSPGGHLQQNCLRPRHTGSAPGVMVISKTLTANLYVSLVIQPIVLSFMNSIRGGVFQQDNDRRHIDDVKQCALEC
ncbi:transposable element Tc1 transposase [Trichonephila clavipes]|nr:transposable element Tc1 transposase [Trichonephila clavipes]